MKPGSEEQKHSLRRQLYLLTCWQEWDRFPGGVIWRFRLESPSDGQLFLFKTLTEAMSKIENDLELND